MLFIHFLDKTPILAFWDMLGQCWLWNEGSSWNGFQIWEMRVAIMSPICLSVGRAGGHKALEGYIHSNERSLSFNSLKLSFAQHVFFFFQFVPWQNGCSSARSFQLPSRSDFSLPAPSSLSASCCEGFLSDRVRGSAISPRLPCSFPIVSSLGPVPLLRYLHSRRLTWTSFILPSPSSFEWLITLLHPSVSSCPSHPRTFLPSTSLLPRSRLHLPVLLWQYAESIKDRHGWDRERVEVWVSLRRSCALWEVSRQRADN